VYKCIMDNIYFYCSMENNSGSLGGHGSEGNPFFGSNQWAYHFATSGSNFDDQGMPQFDAHESDVEEVPRPAASRKGKEKKVSRRKFNFSKEEDVIICCAFLSVNKDPIIGESPR
jgi:hypothetical protein